MTTFERLSLAALMTAALTIGTTPARALDPIDFNLAAPAQATSGAASDDADEDAFFSSAKRRPSPDFTGTIASAGPVQRLPAQRPQVDVAATCRAVLADNLNLYNHNFLESCKRAVTEAGLRRPAR